MKSLRKIGLTPLIRILGLMGVYFAGGMLGKAVSFSSGAADLVWPPFGIALAAILLFGYPYWPGVALGAVIYSVTEGNSLGFFTWGVVLGNTIGALVCAYLLEHFAKFRPSLDRLRDVAGLVLLASLLGTTVTAGFNAAGLMFEGKVNPDQLFSALVGWWIPNSMAVLVITPLILVWGSKEARPWNSSRWVEGAICAAGLLVGTLVSFDSWYIYGIQNYPFAYLPYPFLVWGALRFGPRGATVGTLLVSILAIHALVNQRGPFYMSNQQDSFVLIGSYIGILSITNLLLAALAAERWHAEHLMAESEHRYRAVVEDQTEMVWRFKTDGSLTFANDAFCKFHGKPREELMGTKYFSVLSEEDREIPLSYFGSLPRDNPTVSYDYKLVLPNNNVVWQQCTTRRLFDENGETLEFQSVAQDVTRRKQTEEEIRQAEQRQRAILSSMVDGVVVMDDTGLVTSFNPAAEKIFGRRAEQVLRCPAVELFRPDEARGPGTDMATYLREARAKMVEAAAVRPDGTTVPVELAVSEIKLGGAPLIICVVRDMTERKRLEEQIRQSQKLEAIGRLAGGIAHDFNNLLQAMIGYTNLLLGRMPPAHPDRETVGQIEKAAERAAALTSQLLAFSRKQVLKPKTISLNSIAADMHKLLQRLIGDNIQLVEEPAAELGHIRADPGQIEQVILNLAINARDAMPEGGSLLIRTANADLPEPLGGFSPEFVPGPYVMLAMTDTGSGMTPEIQAHIFEPFFTTKGVGKGTGLGLSIVYGICKQSGGEITVESQPECGTTFRLYFPRVEAPKEKHAAAPPAALVGGTETLLLVEDGEIVRAMLVEVLQTHGYKVIEAVDGDQAIQIAADYDAKIHLLITDLIMPKMNGRHLADCLLVGRHDLRVLFISGYSDDEMVRFGLPEATTDFLQKPFRPEILLAKVRQILDAQSTKA